MLIAACISTLFTAVEASSPPARHAAQVEADAEAGGATALAVLGFESLGLPREEVKLLEEYFVKSVAGLSGFTTIDPLDVELQLEAPRYHRLRTCKGGTGCAARIGKALDAKLVVYGLIAGFGERFHLNLRLVDVRKATVLKRETIPVAGSRHALIPEVRLAAYRLLAEDEISGNLIVRTDIDGVDIFVGDKLMGQTPMLAPIEGLKPGVHTVVLRKRGHSELSQEVQIAPFDTKIFRITMTEAP